MFSTTEHSLNPSPVEGPTEFELKFLVNHAILDRLFRLNLIERRALKRAQTIETIYFDTHDGALFDKNMTLRLRKSGNHKPVMTLKADTNSSSSLFERTEIEVPADPDGMNIDRFSEGIATYVRDVTKGQELIARFQTRFKRRTAAIATAHCHFEISIDEGHFIIDDTIFPLHELELELKKGDPDDLLDFARQLVEAGLRIELTSKSERCFILCGLQKDTIKSSKKAIRPDISLDGMIVTVLSEGLKHFASHIQPFRDEKTIASVHQMRVGLRRLRAAINIFDRAFPEATFAFHGIRAKRIAHGLSLARECDAFHDLVFRHPLAHKKCPKDTETLAVNLAALRSAAYQDVDEVVNSADVTLFIIDMQAYIARRGWRNEISDEQLSILTAPANQFAKSTLETLFKKARKRGKAMAQGADAERHELRIALKKFRYMAQFFAPMIKSRKAYKAWNSTLIPLQNSLGVYNDLVGVEIMIDRLRALGKGDFSHSAGFILGWFAAQSEEAERDIDRQWKKLKKLQKFWI